MNGWRARLAAVLVAIAALSAVLGVEPHRGGAAVAAPMRCPPAGCTPTPRQLCPTRTTRAHARAPAGLIATQILHPKSAAPSVFASGVFADPSIAGVQLVANWDDLEPAQGTFDWAPLDRTFCEANHSGKFVVLTLVPGFSSPGWALASTSSGPCNGPVQAPVFDREYGPGSGETGPLPLPWDQNYLCRWTDFLEQVAARYGQDAAFRMISVDGPTSVSGEMSLPGNAAAESTATRAADIAQWEALQYTPATYEAAWSAIFRRYEEIFPRQYLSLALYPGLPIGNGGGSDSSQSSATPKAVFDAGRQDKRSFAVQENGLTASTRAGTEFDLVKGGACSLVTGLQLTTSATKHAAGLAGHRSGLTAAKPLKILTRTLGIAVAAQVLFVEIYQPDVLNARMAPELSRRSTRASPPTGTHARNPLRDTGRPRRKMRPFAPGGSRRQRTWREPIASSLESDAALRAILRG